jgi:hypothetical protein
MRAGTFDSSSFLLRGFDAFSVVFILPRARRPWATHLRPVQRPKYDWHNGARVLVGRHLCSPHALLQSRTLCGVCSCCQLRYRGLRFDVAHVQ